jgi:hypothetical protein
MANISKETMLVGMVGVVAVVGILMLMGGVPLLDGDLTGEAFAASKAKKKIKQLESGGAASNALKNSEMIATIEDPSRVTAEDLNPFGNSGDTEDTEEETTEEEDTEEESSSSSGDWEGEWDTSDTGGIEYDVELEQDGDDVTGDYTYPVGNEGWLFGEISGDVLIFYWYEGYSYSTMDIGQDAYDAAESDGASYGSAKWTIDTSVTPYEITGSYDVGDDGDDVSWNGKKSS